MPVSTLLWGRRSHGVRPHDLHVDITSDLISLKNFTGAPAPGAPVLPTPLSYVMDEFPETTICTTAAMQPQH